MNIIRAAGAIAAALVLSSCVVLSQSPYYPSYYPTRPGYSAYVPAPVVVGPVVGFGHGNFGHGGFRHSGGHGGGGHGNFGHGGGGHGNFGHHRR
ncbi:MAG: hypothetical protein WCK65_00100 [Rhodospirillaceae bacterium]